MSYTTDRFAIRTVRNGRVKIGGRVYRSQNMEGVERFEGKRMVFGRYQTWIDDGTREGKQVFEPFVSLWGEEGFFRCKTWEEHEAYPYPGIDCDAEGYFSWVWWYWESPDYTIPSYKHGVLTPRDGNRWLEEMGIKIDR